MCFIFFLSVTTFKFLLSLFDHVLLLNINRSFVFSHALFGKLSAVH